MGEKIYVMDGEGSLEALEETPFELEEQLQSLIATHPELLAGEQINPDSPRRWILVSREQGIADTEGSAYRWALDHLLIDQKAMPTLVEVKRGSNSQIRREVVGQMLDYAAYATTTWNVDDIRRRFEESSEDAEDQLVTLLDSDEELDADGFWEQVRANLALKQIRLLFVADKIPDELERVVLFLNEQMPNIEVLAVEVKRFSGGSSRQMLVPRVIGRVDKTSPSRGRSASQRMTRQDFLDKFDDTSTREAASRLLEVVDGVSGAGLSWGRDRVTIRARSPLRRARVSVAWLYATTGQDTSLLFRDFTFGRPVSDDHPVPINARLEAWVKEFADDHFSHKHGTTDAEAYYVKLEDVAANIDVLCERLEKVLTDLRNLE